MDISDIEWQEEEYESASNRSIPIDCPDKEAALQLRQVMSEISEDHYAAGWLIGLEYSLFEAAFEGEARVWGDGGLDTKELGDLFELSHRCDGWWRWNNDDDHLKSGQRFVRMSEWTAIYKAKKER